MLERFCKWNIKGNASECGLPSLYTPANTLLSMTVILTKLEHRDISPTVGSMRLGCLENNIISYTQL